MELPSSAVSNIAELPGSNLILRGPNGHVVREGCGIVAESRKVHAEINMLGTFGRVTFEQAGPDANVVRAFLCSWFCVPVNRSDLFWLPYCITILGY